MKQIWLSIKAAFALIKLRSNKTLVKITKGVLKFTDTVKNSFKEIVIDIRNAITEDIKEFTEIIIKEVKTIGLTLLDKLKGADLMKLACDIIQKIIGNKVRRSDIDLIAQSVYNSEFR